MILEKQKEAIVVTDGDISESIGMSLDLDSAQILMQMLSKNLYSDPIGSTIRECASNALDSHRRVGVDDPIIISLVLNEQNNAEFSVEDFGIGLDADDVENIISKYGKSTKRNSTNELGMMGLGFKSPLAYSSSFYFVCRKDGIERKYMMYEGEEVNTIDFLYEKETDQKNGVKVIVPVKRNDTNSFYQKIKSQLAYFENVYFNVGHDFSAINNKFKIYRDDDFQYSELAEDSLLHICLDNVYYPIDFNKLGIKNIYTPLGIRFTLSDGLYPTPNRESLKYTSESIQIIKDKIQKVSDKLISMYNSKSQKFEKFSDVHDHYILSSKNVKIDDDLSIDISGLLSYGTTSLDKPQLKNYQYLNFEKVSNNIDNLLQEYKIIYKAQKGKITETKITGNDSLIRYRKLSDSESNFFKYSNRLSEVKKSYLRDKYNNYHSLGTVIRKVRSFSLFQKDKSIFAAKYSYYELLGLASVPRSDWRKAIVEFQNLTVDIMNEIVNLDDLIVPIEIVERLKRTTSSKIRRQKLKGDIIVKVAEPLLKHSSNGNYCKFVSDTWELNSIYKSGKFIIYAHHDDSSKINKLFEISKIIPKITLITLSSRELKILEELSLKNVISYNKFMEGDNKAFKRIVTAYLIDKLIRKYSSVFNSSTTLDKISKDLNKSVEILYDYKRKYYCNGSDDLYESILEIAENNNLYDSEMYSQYLQTKNNFEKIKNLNKLFQMVKLNHYAEDKYKIEIIVDLFKYYKVKVNIEHYTNSATDLKVN